jgi:hypothetical protein
MKLNIAIPMWASPWRQILLSFRMRLPIIINEVDSNADVCIDMHFCNLGARAPNFQILKKMVLKSFKTNCNSSLHVHIMLIHTGVSFHEKMRLYVKMTKCLNETIMFGFVLFIGIGTSIFSFLCRAHTIVFFQIFLKL